MSPGRPAQFLRPTLLQLSALLCAVPAILLSLGEAAAVSFVAGALCSVLPQAYFAWRMGRATRRGAAEAARAGLAAEGGKFLLSAVSFALVFAVLRPASPVFVFIGYGAMWVVQMVGAIRLMR
ncbi:MAG: ATP synthase subunit I [Pseudomonadota bacterium]